MNTWKALLLIYCAIDVRYPLTRWRRKRFAHCLTEQDVEEAENSFRHFPPLVRELTEGRASVDYATVHVPQALRTVSPISFGGFWPSPTDVSAELSEYAPPGAFDSVFILWPQNDAAAGRFIPSAGWGFGMGATAAANGATYAVVANASLSAWRRPRIGEVWLHEWLHGVCHHFAQRGHALPEGDADGGGPHGYVQSPTTGWTDYYRDLMNGKVEERGSFTGIQSDAWRESLEPRTLPA